MLRNSRRRQYEQLVSNYGPRQGAIVARHRAMEDARAAWRKVMDRRQTPAWGAWGTPGRRRIDKADGRAAAIFYAAERRHMRDNCPFPYCSAMARKGGR